MSRPEHSSRVGTAWKPAWVQVMGEDVFGQTGIVDLPEGHFRCRYCLNVVRMDGRGYAACENCGMVYNEDMTINQEMSNREKKRRLEKLKYDSRHYKQ